MLRGLSTLLPSRLAAVLMIVVLSGAAGLVPRARAAEHRCRCLGAMVGGRHVCSCPICRLSALQAAAHDRSATPAQRAVAARALDEEMGRPGNGGAPCCSSQCDDSGGAPGVSASRTPFTLPRLPVLLRVAAEAQRADVVSSLVTRHSAPEPPPPRTCPS